MSTIHAGAPHLADRHSSFSGTVLPNTEYQVFVFKAGFITSSAEQDLDPHPHPPEHI